MYASYPLTSHFGRYKHRLLRYNVTDEPAVTLSDHCMWIWPKEKADALVIHGGISWDVRWMFLKMGTRKCILSCAGALIVLELMVVDEVTFLSFSLSSLSRESSILTSAPPVGALVSCRAQRAMGARCLSFGTALRTHSKPSSVPLAMRMGYSAAGAVQAENGMSTCTNRFCGTAPVCNMIFFKLICLSNSVNKNTFVVYFCWFDHLSCLNLGCWPYCEL